MTDTQTEARAIADMLDRFERAAFAATANLPRSREARELESKSRSIEYNAARDAIATALAAKDAELAEVRDELADMYVKQHILAAHLAGANKALDMLGEPPSPIQRLGAAISRRDWREVEQEHAAIRDIVDASRRAREGGKV